MPRISVGHHAVLVSVAAGNIAGSAAATKLAAGAIWKCTGEGDRSELPPPSSVPGSQPSHPGNLVCRMGVGECASELRFDWNVLPSGLQDVVAAPGLDTYCPEDCVKSSSLIQVFWMLAKPLAPA